MDPYNAKIYEYNLENVDEKYVMHCVHGEEDPDFPNLIEVATGVFVDDINELAIGNSVEELRRECTTRTETLEALLASIGAKLEPTKEQVAMRFMGKGAQKEMEKAMQKGIITKGEKLPVARLLGGWIHNNGVKEHEVKKRVEAMKVGFCASGRSGTYGGRVKSR